MLNFEYDSIRYVNPKGKVVETEPTKVLPPQVLMAELIKPNSGQKREAILDFTPQDASQLLKLNNMNKEVRANKVKKFKTLFEEGEYDLFGDYIYVSSTGELLGGQHRLIGLMMSNILSTKLKFCINTTRKNVLRKDEHFHNSRDIVCQSVLGANKTNQKYAVGALKMERAIGLPAFKAKRYLGEKA